MEQLENQEWRPIYGYEDYYEISNTGIIRSIPRIIKLKTGTRKVKPCVLKPRFNNCGYLEVRLSKYDIVVTKFVHALLAETFIPNPDRKKEVNHKNGIKADNCLSNLEWCSHAENIQHAYDTGLLKRMTKPVFDKCTGQEFSSIREAALYFNINQHTLKGYLNGTIKKNPTCLQYNSAA